MLIGSVLSYCHCSGLAKDLQTKLHGQHLAQSVVLKAIQGFINNPESNKPLTLSFHGWSGTGKNFVARIIADNLYRDGVKSECVRLFIAPFHFPHARLVDTYKVRNSWPAWHGVGRSVPGTRWTCYGDSMLCLVRCFVCILKFTSWMITVTIWADALNQIFMLRYKCWYSHFWSMANQAAVDSLVLLIFYTIVASDSKMVLTLHNYTNLNKFRGL